MRRLDFKLKLKTITGILISIVGLAWAFHDFNFNNFIIVLKNTNLIYIGLACISLVFSVWLRAVRWNLLIESDKVTTKNLYDIEMVGYFGNNVLPFRFGEIYRSVLLSTKTELSKSYCFGTIVLERMMDLFGLFLFFLILILFYPVPEEIKSWGMITLSIFLLFVIIFFIFNKIFNLRNYIKLNFIKQFLKVFIDLKFNSTIAVLFWTIIIWLIYLVDTYLIQYAFQLDMSWKQTLLVLVLTSITMAIPSAPGTIGTFHAAVKFTMVSLLGYGADESNTYSIILHAYGFITLTFIGAFYFMNSMKKENLI